MCIYMYVEITIVLKMGYTVKPYIKGFKVLTTCGYGGLFVYATS